MYFVAHATYLLMSTRGSPLDVPQGFQAEIKAFLTYVHDHRRQRREKVLNHMPFLSRNDTALVLTFQVSKGVPSYWLPRMRKANICEQY